MTPFASVLHRYGRQRLPFPHVRQIGRVVRATRRGQAATAHLQIEFSTTDPTPEQADPARLATLIRGRRGIENRLHRIRDATYGDDHSAVRTGHAATATAVLRSTALSLFRLAGHPSIAAAVMARRAERALNLVDRPHRRQHHATIDGGQALDHGPALSSSYTG